jgi:thymidylate synthase
MFDLIVACTKEGGIGINGRMAWYCREDLILFRKKTMNNILILGRKTAQNLPRLNGRTIFCLTRDLNLDTSCFQNKCIIVSSLSEAIYKAKHLYNDKKIFVAGGGEIYQQCLQPDLITELGEMHLSLFQQLYPCDTFIPLYFRDWIIKEKNDYSTFSHYVLRYNNNGEKQYLTLLAQVLHTGISRIGRNGETKSVFKRDLSFDLRQGFPLLTSKKMFWRGVVEECLFFLRGDTDSKKLSSSGVHIWDSNTKREFLDQLGLDSRPEGIMGPMYGYQWRNFNASYDEKTGKPLEKGIDQLALILNTISKDKNSRRIIMTSFNPIQVSMGVLYPCHSLIIQFYICPKENGENGENIDMFCYNRSQDLFHGTPFNIASSALLLTIVAKISGLTPRYLHLTMGDTHIYQSHYKIVEQQLIRFRYEFPSLIINKNLSNLFDVENLSFQDFILNDYKFEPSIKARMVP